MARLLHRRWEPELASGLSRRDRQGCDYEAFVPDPLLNRVLAIEGSVAAEVADAEAAVARLNVEAVALVDSEALARLLLRTDAVASSRIEGLEVGGRRLLRAEAARELGDNPSDITAEEVLANITAIAWAVESVASAERVTLDHLLEMHRLLLAGTRLEAVGGKIRETQNWIGGSSFNPCGASFVPPPPDEVKALLLDLCAFCNEESLPTLVQAALAHAQFETIHPFADGNGRTGRALIHVILRRRGLAPRSLPPISLVLATWSNEYVNGLMGTRRPGNPAHPAAQAGLNSWIGLFAAATSRAVADAHSYERRVLELQIGWRAKAGQVRAGSAIALLLAALPGAPILTVGGAAKLIGRSFQAANGAVDRLVQAGILQPVRIGRRNRAFETPELTDAFTDLERQLASPMGDTRTAPPSRGVARRL